MLTVTVPENVQPGQMIQVTAPSGQQIMVTVPQGTMPGQQINVQVPGAAQAPSSAMIGQPTAQQAPAQAMMTPMGDYSYEASRIVADDGAPSFWYAIMESPSRVTFKWIDGRHACMKRSGMVRHNQRFHPNLLNGRGNQDILPNNLPEQLNGRCSPTVWSDFVGEVQKAAGTYPAQCRCCLFSCCLDACKDLRDSNNVSGFGANRHEQTAKKNLQQVVENYMQRMTEEGLHIQYFDLSGSYKYQWNFGVGMNYREMHIATFGFHVDRQAGG